MATIDKLTPEQEAKLPIYREKWLKIGLCCDPIDENVGRFVSDYYYEKILKKKAVPVEFFRSPVEAWKAICRDNNIEENMKDFIWPYLDGQYFSAYLSFYDFMHNELKVPFKNVEENYEWLMKLGQIGLFYPLPDKAYITDRTSHIGINSDGVLHEEARAAVEYRDGFKVFALHGVRVPEWLVMTPVSQLSGDMLTSRKELKNAEIRREFVRKIGIERCLSQLGWQVIDKKDDYELGTVNVIDNTPRKYLKMLNPSVGVWHLEAVHPDCNTVQDAINWRAYGDKTKPWQPYELT